jgi:hypothetical protein
VDVPLEHWDDLRDGSYMYFIMAESRHKLMHNPEREVEEIVIAKEFLDELVDLGVLMKVQLGEIVANSPLFCLNKPSQPAQWRILSEMGQGKQNEVIGAAPMVSSKV